MRITARAQRTEIATTTHRLAEGLAVVKVKDGVAATGTRALYLTGPAAVRHYLLALRAENRPARRTVRTTHDGRRVVMRRTGRFE